MWLLRLISNVFIADEVAWAICKLSELSSLPVSGSRLFPGWCETQVSLPSCPSTNSWYVCTTYTTRGLALGGVCKHKLQHTGRNVAWYITSCYSPQKLSLIEWWAQGRQGTAVETAQELMCSFILKAIAPGGSVLPPATVLHYEMKGLLSWPVLVTFLP